jgi:hypothetical protein
MKKKITAWIVLMSAVCLQAEEIYHEDFSSAYVKGPLAGQNNWVEQSGKNSPRVYEYPGDGWAVVGKKVSDDAWALLNTDGFGLKPMEPMILEVTLLRGVPNSKEGSTVLVGIGKGGTKQLPASIGASNDGVFVRGGWGPTTYAVKADGTNWGSRDNDPQDYREHVEKIVLRSEWNLVNGTGTLSVKNLTRGETEFTPLYFDAAQTQKTASIGNVWEVESWDQVLIRIGGSGAARVYDIKVSR